MDFMRKKVLNNINDIQLDFQKTKEALKVDIHDIKCKMDHHDGERGEMHTHNEIEQEDIVIMEPKPILKNNGGRRLKSAVNQVKNKNKIPGQI